MGSNAWLQDFCGSVHVDPASPCYLGATKATNNTGELTVFLMACRWIAFEKPTVVTLCYDSELAAKLVQRIWRPTTNIGLVIAARAAYDAACIVATIKLLHIYGHTEELLNERADALAKFGASYGEFDSETQTLARILLDIG